MALVAQFTQESAVKRGMIYGVASLGTEEDFATTVFTEIVQCADRTREAL
jgi:hypothetical protein